MGNQIKNNKLKYLFWLSSIAIIFWIIFGLGLQRDYKNCGSAISKISFFGIVLYEYDNPCPVTNTKTPELSDLDIFSIEINRHPNLRGFPFSEVVDFSRFDKSNLKAIWMIISFVSLLNLIFYFVFFQILFKILDKVSNNYRKIVFIILMITISLIFLIISSINAKYSLSYLTFYSILTIFKL
ncbi:MAG: hypothetical protein WC668_02765 [Patescibacteria group bacterium]|jgi:hypothetical protein